MKRTLLIATGALMMIGTITTNAQDRKESLANDGFYTRETMPQRKPIPYTYVREADVMWSKRIWRIIDLRQKINYPLYFPTELMQDRESLVQRLVRGIKYNEITAYDPIDDEFTTRMSYDQVVKALGAEDQEKTVVDENGQEQKIVIKGEIKWSDIKELLIKEDWFFDKQTSTMNVRIVGICPIIHQLRFLDTGGDEDQVGEIIKKQTFWIYFPETRSILANTDVFNSFNDAQRVSFDDLFFKRRFNSYIIKESNVYDNRLISDYTFGGVQNMQESDRIKDDLFNYEHDLWEY
ncbi:MAG TPA: gliding motility protein GldN [Tenuifilaceae bacterium]|nr:gliding motility protein GldN [Tenuifilaceae bacterium]